MRISNTLLPFIYLFLLVNNLVFAGTGNHLQHTNSAFDIALYNKSDTIQACAKESYNTSVTITNNSSTFVKDIPILYIINNDTTKFRYGISLDSNQSRSFQFRHNMPDSSGLIIVKIVYDSVDGAVLNNVVVFTFNLNNDLKASFIVNNVCDGDTAKFTNTTTYTGSDSVRYEWNMGFGTVYTSKDLALKLSYGAPFQIASYWMPMRAITSKCTSFASKTVLVYPDLKVDFTHQKNGKVFKVLYTMDMDTTAYHYYWDFGDGNHSTTRLPTHTYTVDSQYRVCLTVTTRDSVCSASGCKLTGPVSKVSGQAFIDVNANCTYDLADKPIQTMVFTNKRELVQFTDSLGHYEMDIFGNEDYTVKSNIPSGLIPVCNSDSFDIVGADPDSTYRHDFIYNAQTYDIEVRAIPDTVVACHAQKYSRTVFITNNTPILLKEISFSMTAGKDTVLFTKTINLTSGTSDSIEIDNISLPDTSGLIHMNLSCTEIDDDTNNNSVVLSFLVSNHLKAGFTADSMVCHKNKTQFTNTTRNASQDSISFIWEPGDGKMYTTRDVEVLLPNSGPNKPITYRPTLTAISQKCTSTVVHPLTIFPQPFVDFSFKRSGNEFKALSVTKSDSLKSYVWEFGDGNKSTDSLPIYYYKNSDYYVVSLSATNVYGCSYTRAKLTAPTSFVTGRSFLDVNKNCLFDSSDLPLRTTVITGRWIGSTNKDGYYNLVMGAGTNYTIRPSPISNLTLSCKSDSMVIVNAKEDSTYEHDFIYTLDTTKTDYGLRLGHNIVTRGQESSLHITVSAFCIPQKDSLTIELNYDPRQEISYANRPFKLVSAGRVLFKIMPPTLMQDEFIFIKLDDPNGRLKLGDTVKYVCRFVKQDDVTQNDIDSNSTIVRAPYDPNAKISNPEGGVLKPIRKASYVIQFQNVGNATAKNVEIFDLLDTNLLSNTVVVTGASHPDDYEMNIQNNLVKWSFKDIHLPDSSSDVEGSKGYVSFEVDVAPTFKAVGDTIHNKALIYFDFEDAIETNTASIFMVDKPAFIYETKERLANIRVYPNPSHDEIHVENLSMHHQKITIQNSSGVVIKSFFVDPFQVEVIDVSSLVSGLYFLSDEHGNSLKFIKVK